MFRNRPYITFFAAVLPLLLALLVSPASGEEVDELAVSLGFASDEAISVSRFPRPISKIAENVTVITAKEIARLNAHTLADVLQTVPGIQMAQVQGPGSASNFFYFLGVSSRHILVQLDGVPLNFLSLENLSEVGSIPVQMIERVEIVKGAASAAWGSALGGVINITTKTPATSSVPRSLASVSFGDKSTSDLRGEVTGSVERLGYYLTGGRLRSDGLAYGNWSDLGHAFGKFSYDLPDRGRITLGVDFRDNNAGLERDEQLLLRPASAGPPPVPEWRGLVGTGGVGYLNSYLALSYPLAERLTLQMSGRGGKRRLDNERVVLSPGFVLQDAEVTERYHGAVAGLSWGDADTNLSAGVEYENNDLRQRDPVTRSPLTNFDMGLERYSGYLSGTYTIGPLSILPGVRFDSFTQLEEELSYTLGATLRLSQDTVLRAYGARGYSTPVISNLEILNGARQMQNVWTVQTGIESSAIPYLWLKGTLSYNNNWKIQTYNPQYRALYLRGQIRQGVDLEFRTSPIYGLALSGGYSYTKGWDKKSHDRLTGPRQGAKLALNYDHDLLGLQWAVTGNYVDWYFVGADEKDTAVIWDLHLAQKLFPRDELSPELFCSLRNIFNGDQYQIRQHANTPRWFEAGVRYRF